MAVALATDGGMDIPKLPTYVRLTHLNPPSLFFASVRSQKVIREGGLRGGGILKQSPIPLGMGAGGEGSSQNNDFATKA